MISTIKKVASISLLSILSLGLIYVLFSPLLIAGTSKSSMDNPLQSYSSKTKHGTIVSFFSYPFSYPEIALAAASGTTVVGVTVSREASVTAPATVTLTPSIPGVSGNGANSPSSGTANFIVQTSSPAGFSMSLYASPGNPALATGAYTFADYTPATAGLPDYTWVDPVGSPATTAFGFSVGADVATNAVLRFRNGGSACGAGANNSTTNCIYTFRSAISSATAIPVISSSTFATNATETIKFFASFRDTNLNYAIPADVYQASITATVAAL